MWRKLALLIYRIGAEGNTSTYVEKTLRSGSRKLVIWKHLHVCGENSRYRRGIRGKARNTSTYVEKTALIAYPKDFEAETPPRMWRKHTVRPVTADVYGNTSTYVEKTAALQVRAPAKRKHLHVCGENVAPQFLAMGKRETPPRMWRKHRFVIF